jgi:hypothetical protein
VSGSAHTRLHPVDPKIVARVDRTLKERNVDGKVPMDIYTQLLDEMATPQSCATYHSLRLSSMCPHHPLETP